MIDDLIAEHGVDGALAIVRDRAQAMTDAQSGAQFPCAVPDCAASGLAELYCSPWFDDLLAFLDSEDASANYAQAAAAVHKLLQLRGADRGTAYPLELVRALAILYRRVMAATPHARSLT